MLPIECAGVLIFRCSYRLPFFVLKINVFRQNRVLCCSSSFIDRRGKPCQLRRRADLIGTFDDLWRIRRSSRRQCNSISAFGVQFSIVCCEHQNRLTSISGRVAVILIRCNCVSRINLNFIRQSVIFIIFENRAKIQRVRRIDRHTRCCARCNAALEMGRSILRLTVSAVLDCRISIRAGNPCNGIICDWGRCIQRGKELCGFQLVCRLCGNAACFIGNRLPICVVHTRRCTSAKIIAVRRVADGGSSLVNRAITNNSTSAQCHIPNAIGFGYLHGACVIAVVDVYFVYIAQICNAASTACAESRKGNRHRAGVLARIHFGVKVQTTCDAARICKMICRTGVHAARNVTDVGAANNAVHRAIQTNTSADTANV